MLNHFPTNLQNPQPWFTKPAPIPGAGDFELKESMFEKPLTPSDVGKLNRLVIPKQHAERYFPLGAGDSAGTLLGFEDECGKSWRFRYSYWNSSQSYVLTKGWSRYVKDKRLDAGDVVFFERHRLDRQKLFIGWRRRAAAVASGSPVCYNAQGYHLAQGSSYQPDFPPRHLGGGPEEEEEKPTRVQSISNNNIDSNNNNQPRRLVRLFGVNFECDESESSSSTSSPTTTTSFRSNQQQPYHSYFNYMGYPSSNPSTYRHHLTDMEFDLQMGNRLG